MQGHRSAVARSAVCPGTATPGWQSKHAIRNTTAPQCRASIATAPLTQPELKHTTDMRCQQAAKMPSPCRILLFSNLDPECRRNVGICVCNDLGKVFAARRVDDMQGTFQMPQGGIDLYENPFVAAQRELLEETGMHSVTFVAQIDSWLDYEFPTTIRSGPGPWTCYRGQTQKWLLYQFHGDEQEIALDLHGTQEFDEWRWLPLEDLPASVVSFKQAVYIQVAHHFAPIIAKLAAQAQHTSQ